MDVIPAIDLLEGQAVRLFQGDYQQSERYSADPVALSRAWNLLKIPRLHVVDLSGAKAGHPIHKELLVQIVKAVDCPVQTGGGLRTLEHIAQVIELGVERAILGTVAVEQPELVARACERFPGRIAVGIDARSGKVAIRGWQENSEVEAVTLARQMEVLGVAAIIYTDILRDGTLRGPNLEELRKVSEAVQIPVIASGGVGSLSDLLQLLTLEPQGVTGAIVGKAIYTGDVDLKEALRAVGNPRWQDVPPEGEGPVFA
jgi:phosphoribosylformimino-5-aminoimidazole carboxamide ribotide isomerase